MNRSLNVFFVRARAHIEPVLAELGFQLFEDLHTPAAFGSAYSTYSRRHTDVRLIWDGKEGALLAVYRTTSGWLDVERDAQGLPKNSPYDTEHTDERIERLAAAIRAVFGGSSGQ